MIALTLKTFLRAGRVRKVRLRRCFACLKVHHAARGFQVRKLCQKDGCDRYHHQQLQKDPGNSVAFQINGHKTTISSVVLLLSLPVRLSGSAGYFDTFAKLDEGASVTVIDKTVKCTGR